MAHWKIANRTVVVASPISQPPPPPPKSPSPPPFALQITSIGGNTTKLLVNTPTEAKVVQIETRVKIKKGSTPHAGDPFSTPSIAGISNRHAGERSYGPKGAYSDVGDPYGRNIHGGGDGRGILNHFAPRQGWLETAGCTRGQNEDVINLGNEIKQFRRENPTALPIPYSRRE